MCQLVSDFLSYVSAKYYLNWFTVGKLLQELLRPSAVSSRLSTLYQESERVCQLYCILFVEELI